MQRIIKAVTFQPRFGEMDVEYYGEFGIETLKQCLCCDSYHPIYIGACPKTGKIIAEVAHRQAEEEELLREMARRQEKVKGARLEILSKAEEARRNYLLTSHFNEPLERWRFIMVMPGTIIILIVSVILTLVLRDLSGLSGMIASFIWLFFWWWCDESHMTAVRNQANALYQRVLNGEKVEEIG